MAQRRRMLLSDTEDVARKDQLFIEQAYDELQAYMEGNNVTFAPANSLTIEQMLEGTTPIDTPRHNFKNFDEARQWAKENIVGTYKNADTGSDIYISSSALGKYLSEKAVKKSVSMDAHLATLSRLPSLIKTSLLKEVSQDVKNSDNMKEIQRFYGAVDYQGNVYPVKLTVKATKREGNKAYSYEVMDIENPNAERLGQSVAGTSEAAPVEASSLLPSADKSTTNKSNNQTLRAQDDAVMFLSKAEPANAADDFNIDMTAPPVRSPGEKFMDYHQRLRDWQTMRTEAANQSDDVQFGSAAKNRLYGLQMALPQAFFSAFDGKLACVNCGFASVNRQFASVNHGFTSVNCGFASVNHEFTSVNCGFASVNHGLTSVNCQFASVNHGFTLVKICTKQSLMLHSAESMLPSRSKRKRTGGAWRIRHCRC
jgi:hypothetical protein